MRLFCYFYFFLSRNSLSIPSAMNLWKKNARLYLPETFEISSFVIIPKEYSVILPKERFVIKGSKVLIMGLTYKENVPDTGSRR